MAPQKIKRVAVQYENGDMSQWEVVPGKGNIQLRDNMVPENEQSTTPKPHHWTEVHIVAVIEEK